MKKSFSEDAPDAAPLLRFMGSSSSEDSSDDRVYFVPYRWWKEAQDSTSRSDLNRMWGVLYVASRAIRDAGPMKLMLFKNLFNSDLFFSLERKEACRHGYITGDVGGSRREYALVSGEMWLQALKWHSNCRSATKYTSSFSSGETDVGDVYPLQLRIVLLLGAYPAAIKITKKDNAVKLFRRACKIFKAESVPLHIWDFSGQINMLTSNEKNRFQTLRNQEVLLELQIYGLSDSVKARKVKMDDDTVQHIISGSFCSCGPIRTNRSTFSGFNYPQRYAKSGSLGLTGLRNLGNTCFMNSALQCLAHTPKLIDYFLADFTREINHNNPLGMDGEIALGFGELIRMLWTPGATPVPPRVFMSKLTRFAPQFSDFNQHDSQELLAFLLDALHEDLNRVKSKPYFEAKDGEGRPDEEVADEYWQNHLACNDSIIVNVCQGQLKSTLVCPICKKVAITFDPFMYLTVPLPSSTVRSMSLTVISTDGAFLPLPLTVTVHKCGRLEDLMHALRVASSLPNDEMFLVAGIYNHSIIRFLEDPADSLSLIRDEDCLVAYFLPKDTEKTSLVVFRHQRKEKIVRHDYLGKQSSYWKAFGIPLLTRFDDKTSGSDLNNLYHKLLSPFILPIGNDSNDQDASQTNAAEGTAETDNIITSECNADVKVPDVDDFDSSVDTDFEFWLADEKGNIQGSKIEMTEPIRTEEAPRQLHLVVRWPEKKIQLYDTGLLNRRPDVLKLGVKTPQESVSLYKCLETFLKEEPLGPEDMWYCPNCKEHQQAIKKLDLWRLPEILVIHLKRFSYNRYMGNKLETVVDFPIDDLDLTSYIAHKDGNSTSRYMLYAMSNHYGGLGVGHYTASVRHGGGKWYDFDDCNVYPINKDKLKTSAAYVLFYRRITDF